MLMMSIQPLNDPIQPNLTSVGVKSERKQSANGCRYGGLHALNDGHGIRQASRNQEVLLNNSTGKDNSVCNV